MSNELAKVSKENADMRKAIVLQERELNNKLISKEFEYQQKEKELEINYKNREYSLKTQLFKTKLVSRFIIYTQLIIMIALVSYYIFRNHF